MDDDFQTSVENIYAAGDVIGFPSLAATSVASSFAFCCSPFIESPSFALNVELCTERIAYFLALL